MAKDAQGHGSEKRGAYAVAEQHNIPTDHLSQAQELRAAYLDRTKFDGLLEQHGALPAAQLKLVATHYLGYAPNTKTKSDLLSTMRKRQRQDELNHDRTKAQERIVP